MAKTIQKIPNLQEKAVFSPAAFRLKTKQILDVQYYLQPQGGNMEK